MLFLLSNGFPELPQDIKSPVKSSPLLPFVIFTNCLLFYVFPAAQLPLLNFSQFEDFNLISFGNVLQPYKIHLFFFLPWEIFFGLLQNCIHFIFMDKLDYWYSNAIIKQ